MNHVDQSSSSRIDISPESPSGLNTWQRWLLNTGAVFGVVCLLFTAMTLIFGLKPLIFSSGSMAPAIPAGALAVAVPVPANEVHPGQVVSVLTSDGVRVTHRVVSTAASGGLVLKGDANPVADLQPYTAASVDRVVFSVPGLGYVASWFASPVAFAFGGLLCAYLIYVAFFRAHSHRSTGETTGRSHRGRHRVPPKSGNRRRSWLRIGVVVTALAVIVPLGVVSKVEPTQAAWTRQAAANSSITAAIMPAASNMKCAGVTGNSKAIKFSWSAPAVTVAAAPLKGYTVTIWRNSGGSSPTMIGDPVTASYGSGTTEVVIDGSQSNGILGQLLVDLVQLLTGFSYTYTVTVTAQFGSANWTWNAQPYVTNSVSVSAGALGLNLAVKCT